MRILPTAARAQLLLLRIFNYFGFRRSPVALFAPRARVFFRDEFPLVSYREVFVDRCYEPPLALPDRPRIVDVGAHLGMASLYFARRFPGATIDTYEANPEASELLRRTLANERASSIHIHARALGPAAGTARLYIASGPRVPTDASLLQRGLTDRPTVEVPVDDIRDAVSGRIDLLKLDIEGMEYDCLDALSPTPDTITCLVIEFHDCILMADRLRARLAALRAAGYRLLDEQRHEFPPNPPSGREAMVIWAVGAAA